MLALVSVPVLTRALGPGEFGIYAVCLSVHAFLLPLAADPTSNALRRLHGRAVERADPDRLTRAGLGLALALSSAVALAAAVMVLALTSVFSLDQWRGPLLATAAVTGLFTLFQYLLTTLYVRERVAATSTAQIVHSVMKVIALISGALAVHSATGSLAAYAVALVVLVLWISRRAPWSRAPRIDRPSWRQMLRFGTPLIAVSLSWALLAGFDRLTLTLFFGEAAAGQYAVAYIVSEGSISLLAQALRYATYPTLVRFWEQDAPAEMRATLEATVDVFLILAMTVVALLAVAGSAVAEVFGGGEYRVPALVPMLVGGGLIIYELAYFESTAYQLRLDTAALARRYVIAACACLPITVGAVALDGLRGAALATLLCYAIFLALIRAGRVVPGLTAYPLKRLPKIIGIGAALALAGSQLPLPLGIGLVLACQPILGALVLGRWRSLSRLRIV